MKEGLPMSTISAMRELKRNGTPTNQLAKDFGLSTTTIKKYTKGIISPIATKEKPCIKESSAVDEKFKKNIIKQQKVKLLCSKLIPGQTYTVLEKGSAKGYTERKVTIISNYKNYIDAVINGYRESILKADILTGHVVIKGVAI